MIILTVVLQFSTHNDIMQYPGLADAEDVNKLKEQLVVVQSSYRNHH